MANDTLRLHEKGGLAMHIMTGLLGAAVGMAIAAVIWAVVVSLRKKRSGDAPQFDERQLAARAKAYSSAFFTLLGYLAVVALLHDVCKTGYYRRERDGKYSVKDRLPMGHGEKSVYLVMKFMDLTDEEALAIRWHMGAYDDAFRGGSRALNEAQDKCALVLALHHADMQATQEEKRREGIL